MKIRNLFFVMIFSSMIGGGLTLGGYKMFLEKQQLQSFENQQNTTFARYLDKDTTGVVVPEGLNFIYASNVVRPTVVHIKSSYASAGASGGANPQQNDPMYRFFFDEPGSDGHRDRGPREASGSGVIISPDGYIVTNNHVIENASQIEVVLDDKRMYVAKLIGRDPETDLALLKIEEKGLPFAKYGNSDKMKVGEWVLACGNPFDLTSTITAGIISAKGRNINLLRGKNNSYAIESFIQTDAAVNPGNSGGALVNLKGELIGINTAIASNTGAYAGYSFAVPVTLVKKVMDDLFNHGEVQRALLGVMIQDVSSELAKEKNLKDIKGVYVSNVNEGSAAKDAGIQSGDVIIKIDDYYVNSSSELQEVVAQHRPGEKVIALVIRNGKEITKTVTLKNKKGNFNIIKESAAQINEDLGAEFGELSKEEKEKLKIQDGVKIGKVLEGKLKDAGVKAGFVITKIDKADIKTPKDIAKALEDKSGGILIEGIYPDGKKAYYAIGW
jgi:serine protease Do